MKEILLWISIAILSVFGIYQIDKANKENGGIYSDNIKKGKDNTDCVIMPEHPDCNGSNFRK